MKKSLAYLYIEIMNKASEDILNFLCFPVVKNTAIVNYKKNYCNISFASDNIIFLLSSPFYVGSKSSIL